MNKIIPFERINWTTSIFLLSTALISITAVPVYLWYFGIDSFLGWMFFGYFIATGLSITLGYHRLFSHLSFKAKWPIKLFTLLFGAAAFENSALDWVSDHRIHHKHVDEEEDPYNIKKGFFHAHIGWLLFKLNPEEDDHRNVADLKKDPLVLWQHRYCHRIGFAVGFVLPTILGYLHSGPVGALGGFLIPGIARLVFVQHMTFFINSLCHYIGNQPYSSKCSARDSALMAVFTFGEGYHNYHHEFQHDYRNGVKPWQFDPTKWTIWILEKIGLVSNLRRVPEEKILLAEIQEAQRKVSSILDAEGMYIPDSAMLFAKQSLSYIQETSARLSSYTQLIQDELNTQVELSKKTIKVCKQGLHKLKRELEIHLKIVRNYQMPVANVLS